MWKSTATTAVVLGGAALVGLGTVVATRSPAVAQAPAAALAPAPVPAARAPKTAQRDETRDHIKTIMLGFHNFEGATTRLPAAAIFGSDGQPKLSWRVALLPYLDEAALYNEFHLDEPWDSPHNKALIPRMPDVFKTPNSPAPEGKTRFRGFAGKGAIFEGVTGVRFADVLDGLSNTLMFAVAAEPVTWTQPGELPFVQGQRQPLPPLDDTEPDGYLVGMADGAAHVIKKGLGPVLQAIITRAGGEVVNWDLVGVPFQATINPPAPPGPATVEQRLQDLEGKIDLILKKLDRLEREKPYR